MKIVITRRAEKNIDSIVSYLILIWGDKTAKEFIEKVDKIFSLLISYPLMGNIEKKDIRGFQLTHQTRILYRVAKEKVIILSFFDVRQNPKKRT